MFNHRKIRNDAANDEWNTIKKTISSTDAYNAAIHIGELSAVDMLEFSGLNKHEINKVYVKHRDGWHNLEIE